MRRELITAPVLGEAGDLGSDLGDWRSDVGASRLRRNGQLLSYGDIFIYSEESSET